MDFGYSSWFPTAEHTALRVTTVFMR